MSENDDPESTIPWPGFVDILSTVIIVFVFFMMMTSVIIFVLSEQAKKAAVSEAQKQSESEVNQNDTKNTEKLQPDVSNLLMEKEALQKEIAKLTQLKNVLSESMQQTTEATDNEMTIHFGDMGATITKETDDAIRAHLPPEVRVTIHSIIPLDSNFSSIREIALNRALNIRNVLIQSGVPNDHITLRIVTQEQLSNEQSDNVYGSVKLTFAQ